MSIIDNTSKTIMVQAMRNVLENSLMGSTGYLSESKIISGINYVNESATYEQLLNLTFNPFRDSNYLPAHVLEGAAAILYSACLTGRRKIGPTAIAEGALNLQESTGCVITESMLDAAYNAVKYGVGLQVVGEAYRLTDYIGGEDFWKNVSKKYRQDMRDARQKYKGAALRSKLKALRANYQQMRADFVKNGTIKSSAWQDKGEFLGDSLKKIRDGRTPKVDLNKELRDRARQAGLTDEIIKGKEAERAKQWKAGLLGTNPANKELTAIRGRALHKYGRGKMYKGLGIGAAAGLGTAAAGYGLYKWLKNKKKKNDD